MPSPTPVLEAFDQGAGWDGVRDAFGRVVEPGWARQALPIEPGQPAGQSWADVTKEDLLEFDSQRPMPPVVVVRRAFDDVEVARSPFRLGLELRGEWVSPQMPLSRRRNE